MFGGLLEGPRNSQVARVMGRDSQRVMEQE